MAEGGPSTSSNERRVYGMQNITDMVKFMKLCRKDAPPPRDEYQFTLYNRRLTGEQRFFYEKNGYIIIPKLVPLECLERYWKRFQDICDRRVRVPGLLTMKDFSFDDVSDVVRPLDDIFHRLEDFVYDDVLFEYCKIPEVLDYVECFCGPNIKAMRTVLINKSPDLGDLIPDDTLHQDLVSFPFRPANRIVCVWTAVEKVNRANGCLGAVAGSHKCRRLIDEEFLPEWEDDNNPISPDDEPYYHPYGLRRVYFEMEAGDTVFFHPSLIHGSGPNRTNGFRKAISCHYAASECEYIDEEGNSKQKAVAEVLGDAREVDYLDDDKFTWQIKGRLVRGEEVNL